MLKVAPLGNRGLKIGLASRQEKRAPKRAPFEFHEVNYFLMPAMASSISVVSDFGRSRG
jgi:hypothetical protein